MWLYLFFRHALHPGWLHNRCGGCLRNTLMVLALSDSVGNLLASAIVHWPVYFRSRLILENWQHDPAASRLLWNCLKRQQRMSTRVTWCLSGGVTGVISWHSAVRRNKLHITPAKADQWLLDYLIREMPSGAASWSLNKLWATGVFPMLFPGGKWTGERWERCGKMCRKILL